MATNCKVIPLLSIILDFLSKLSLSEITMPNMEAYLNRLLIKEKYSLSKLRSVRHDLSMIFQILRDEEHISVNMKKEILKKIDFLEQEFELFCSLIIIISEKCKENEKVYWKREEKRVCDAVSKLKYVLS